jgi:hypothetical protein
VPLSPLYREELSMDYREHKKLHHKHFNIENKLKERIQNLVKDLYENFSSGKKEKDKKDGYINNNWDNNNLSN